MHRRPAVWLPSRPVALASVVGVSIGDELALRAGLDPAWDAVLAVYLRGLSIYPPTFQPREPVRFASPSVQTKPPAR